jgi:hypothetical protein
LESAFGPDDLDAHREECPLDFDHGSGEFVRWHLGTIVDVEDKRRPCRGSHRTAGSS